jgi:hypothetical protein
MIGVDGIGVMPIGVSESETPPPFTLLSALRGTEVDVVYLVDLYPYQPGDPEFGAGLEGIGVGPIGAFAEDSEQIEDTAGWYLSDRGWVSGADDDPAHQYFEARARVPIVIDRVIPVAPEQERRLQVQYGAIDLDGADGFFDTLVANSAIDGRRVRVRIKEYDAPLSSAVTIFDGSGVSWSGDDATLRLNVRDNGYLLEVRLQPNTYGGTGGADGNEVVAGVVKPLCYGRPLNITPVLIDPANRVYQIHDGAIQAVDNVYDRAAALAFDADYADYATLIAASIPSGEYGTCLALGMFRLGAPPAGLVTCDPQGGFNGDDVYIDTSGAIALHLIRVFGDLAESKLRASAFSSIDSSAPYEVGWYWPDPTTVAAALNDIFAGLGAWWGPQRDGRITVGRIDEPSPRSSTDTLTTVELLDLQPVEPPPGIFPPSWRRRVAYEWNWTVQRGEDIASSVDDERRQWLAQPFRFAENVDTSVRARNLLATDPPVLPARFNSRTAAQNEADRLQPVFGTPRSMFVGRLKTIGHLDELGTTKRIVWPRHGLQTGKYFRIVGMREEGDRREVSPIFWG